MGVPLIKYMGDSPLQATPSLPIMYTGGQALAKLKLKITTFVRDLGYTMDIQSKEVLDHFYLELEKDTSETSACLLQDILWTLKTARIIKGFLKAYLGVTVSPCFFMSEYQVSQGYIMRALFNIMEAYLTGSSSLEGALLEFRYYIEKGIHDLYYRDSDILCEDTCPYHRLDKTLANMTFGSN